MPLNPVSGSVARLPKSTSMKRKVSGNSARRAAARSAAAGSRSRATTVAPLWRMARVWPPPPKVQSRWHWPGSGARYSSTSCNITGWCPGFMAREESSRAGADMEFLPREADRDRLTQEGAAVRAKHGRKLGQWLGPDERDDRLHG